jgi:hypothetical protein
MTPLSIIVSWGRPMKTVSLDAFNLSHMKACHECVEDGHRFLSQFSVMRRCPSFVHLDKGKK